METGGAARAVEYGGLQVVKDHGARLPPKNSRHARGFDRTRLRCESVNSRTSTGCSRARRRTRKPCGWCRRWSHDHTHPNRPASPGRLVVDFLVDASARRADSDGAEIAAEDARAAGKASGPRAISSRMRTARVRGPLPRAPRSWLVCVEETGAAHDPERGGLVHFERSGHGTPGTVSRRAMARPERFSISARRRISAHRATLMARLLAHATVARRRPGATVRQGGPVPGQAPLDGAGRAAAGRAPG